MGQGRSWNLIQDHLGWEKISENSRPAPSDHVNSAQVTPLSSDLSFSLISVTCSSGAWQTAPGQWVGDAACPEAIWQLTAGRSCPSSLTSLCASPPPSLAGLGSPGRVEPRCGLRATSGPQLKDCGLFFFFLHALCAARQSGGEHRISCFHLHLSSSGPALVLQALLLEPALNEFKNPAGERLKLGRQRS